MYFYDFNNYIYIFMIFNSYDQYENRQNNKVLIIGSGPASISLALKLEKNQISSVIFEAGTFDYNEKLQDTYKGTTSGDYKADITTNRIKQFGGTANVWGQVCRPLDEIDIANWSKKKLNIKEYEAEASKILFANNNYEDEYLDQNFNQNIYRYSKVDFPKFYKNIISNSKFIDLVLNSNFTGFYAQNGLFKKAKFLNVLDKKYFEVNADFFILGCGGIDNSRFLLKSRDIDGLLTRELPIGKFWMGHFKEHTGELLADWGKLKKILNVNQYISSQTATISISKKFLIENKMENASVFIQPNQLSKNKFNEIQKKLLCVAPKYSRKLIELFNKKLLCGSSLEIIWGQKPSNKNKITLSKSKLDVFGTPLVNIHCSAIDSDLITPKLFTLELAKYFIEKDIGRVSIFENVINNKDKISFEGNHHLGGTVMGDFPQVSVVDHNLKVHNTKNLFVVGSSIFAQGGYANPTLSIVQFSLRLGDHIKKEIKNI